PLRPRAVEDDETTQTGRIPLAAPTPFTPGGFASKAFAGEVVPFEVVAFREGHDRIGAQVRLTAPDGTESLHRLSALEDGTDRWQAEIALDLQGTWHYRFEAFGDDFATWAHDAAVKLAAGIDVAVMTALGQRLFARAADERARP